MEDSLHFEHNLMLDWKDKATKAEARVVEVEAERDDLAALVGKLVNGIRKFSPEGRIAEEAIDYLKRHKLALPLR